MGLKKKSKVSAEFSMSSLTDIIFLLLIFFMLTSSLVSPNALNLKLPSSSNVKAPSTSKITDIGVKKNGTFYINGKRTSESNLAKSLRTLSKKRGKQVNITISPAAGTPIQHVVMVMDLAMRYNINAILAAEK